VTRDLVPGTAVLRAAALLASGSVTMAAVAADSAVIFMYHHVAEDTPPATSIAPARFESHLTYLEREGFEVLPLLEVVDALARNEPVPDRTVVITFDDGYSSVLDTALPALARRRWPFTVFVSTESVDAGYGGYLGWSELRQLAAAGATIGNHTVSHAHLVRRAADESDTEWRRSVEGEIQTAAERLQTELGSAAIPVLAYPYGEYTLELKQFVADLGLIALGQQSGAISSGSDWQALPRFPMATGFDDLEEFALKARTRPLPAMLAMAERHIVDAGEERPLLRIELPDGGDFRRTGLACYASGQGKMALSWIGQGQRQVEVRPSEPLRPGRTKYNCTAPSVSESGVYYWFSYLWMRPQPDGRWYSE
jgi:peptidoglycan/xylan/chitin deacetylase (PgdA/CDA1 family)